MRPRALITFAAATLAVALAAVATLGLTDQFRQFQARGTPDVEGTHRLADQAARTPLVAAPVVAEPDAPVIAEVELPSEPFVRPQLEPKLPPVPDVGAWSAPAWLGASWPAVAVRVPPAPAPLAAPDEPVLWPEPDLSEGLAVPALAPATAPGPFRVVASSGCPVTGGQLLSPIATTA